MSILDFIRAIRTDGLALFRGLRRASFVAGLAFPILFVAAPAVRAEAPNSARAVEASKGFLWSVKSKTTTVYLLGSIHVADDSLYPLSDEIPQAFAGSSVVALEVDPATNDQSEMQAIFFKNGVYREKGKNLKTVLTPELYARLIEELKINKLNINGVDRLWPWPVRIMILQSRLAQAGYRAERGIDIYFHAAVREREMTIEALGTCRCKCAC